MLKVLTFLTLKGLTIGMVLLTVAYTYSIKKHHAHHGHYAHYGPPATIIKTASHSYPERHIHVPKYHSHYSSFHHPHHHHYPHHHHPHKKYHYSPGYHHHGHHFKHAPEHIEIVKDVHVHSAKPHLYHKHAPEIHSHEYVKDGPIIEYSPHKHHHSDHHTVKKRYPNPQPAIDHTNENDNSYYKPPKKSHRPKIHEPSLGPKSPYSHQKDFSKYGAIKEEHPNDSQKENGFSPVNLHNFPPYYTASPVSYGGGGGEYVENPVNYAPSYVPESYAVSNVVDNYAGGNMVTDYAGSGVVQGYAGGNMGGDYAGGNMGGGYTGGNMGGGYTGSNMVADYPSSNMAAGYVGSSITADFGGSNGAAGYAPNTFLSTYSGGSSDVSYNPPAPSPQNDIKNEYFTNHKDYMSSNIKSEEYSNPVVNSQQDYTKPYATDGEGTNSYQYQNDYSNDQQSKYAGPVAPSYNTDSSYDNVNSYDQSTNEAKYPYSSKNKYTPLLEPENTYKSNASPFFVNIPNLPEEEKSDFEETSDDKKVTSQPNEDSSSYQESMESPIFESSKINNYDSSISSSFSEDSSYNDQQPESYSSSSKNNFDMTNERTNSFNSVLKNENSAGSSFHEPRVSFSNEEQKTMQELEFEPAWAYILFNNQNSLDNSTSTTSNDLEAETSNPMPSINC